MSLNLVASLRAATVYVAAPAIYIRTISANCLSKSESGPYRAA